MTSLDVRDMLNLPQDGAAPRPAKRAKTAAPRTNLKGLAREVQSLGGDNPIAIIPEVPNFKRRRTQATKKFASRWELRPFKNSARSDDSLILRHWRRKSDAAEKAPAPAPAQENSDMSMAGDESQQQQQKEQQRKELELEDSAFAKFNVHVDVPQYTDDQYNSNLRRDDWSKDETDYLLDLCNTFDLRWPIIWDRYEYRPPRPDGDASNGDDAAVVSVTESRSMEDLKARYYEVAAKMMAVQKPAQYMSQPEFALYEMMLKFDPRAETQRKMFAANALSRSKEEAREEESLLLEVKRILARQERFNEERRDLYRRLDFPPSDQDISTFKSSQGLETLLKNLMTADKSKKRKSLMAADGASPASAGGPNGQQPPAGVGATAGPSAGAESRRESIAASSAGGHRDSIAAEKPTPTEPPSKANHKKGAAQPERRKLTEQEEQVYGVSYHDRLGSGPTFRYERVNKLFNHKSGQQQQRITNVLNELDVPSRLTMPTAPVTAQFEQLVHTVTQLVDLRKQLDKLDGEIKIELARKAEREKALGITANKADNATNEVDESPAAEAGEKPAAVTGGGQIASPAKPPPPFGAGPEGATNEPSGPADLGAGDRTTTNGDTSATNEVNGDADKDEPVVPPASANDDGAGDKDKAANGGGPRPSSRPGSRHKRSASVLSAGSDKGKRQKR